MNGLSKLFTSNAFVIAGATICCLLWGSAYPAIKEGYALLGIAPDDFAGKFLFAGYRFICAGVLLLAWSRLRYGTSLRLSLRQCRQVSTLGFFQTALQYAFFYVGLAYTTGTLGSILNATTTFFSVFIAHFLYLNDRLSFRKILGCCVGFLGVIIASLSSDGFLSGWSLIGEGFVLIAAFLLAASSIYGKEISLHFDPVILSGYQLTFGGVLLTLTGYAFGGTFTINSWSLLLLMTYMVLLSSVAFALWTLLLKYNPVSRIAPYNFLIPVSGAILSAVFLHESLFSWRYLLALLLVCSGILIVTARRATRRTPPLL